MDRERARWVYSLDNEMERTRLLMERGIAAQRELYVGESKRFLVMVDLAGGVERMLKLAWAMQVKNETGKFPTKSQFKGSGHGLLQLTERVADGYPSDFLARHLDARWGQQFLRSDVVFREALRILDDFARAGRYFHVDSLGGEPLSADSPERAWEQLEMRISHELFPDPDDWARRVVDLVDDTLRIRVREYLAHTFEVFGCLMFRLFVVGLPNTEARQWSSLWGSFLNSGWKFGANLGDGRILTLRPS